MPNLFRGPRGALFSRLDRCFGFHHFDDCQAGSARERAAALRGNQESRELMLPYVNRWAQVGGLAFFWLQISSQAHAPIWAQAALGVAFSLAVPITLAQAAAWLLLGARRD